MARGLQVKQIWMCCVPSCKFTGKNITRDPVPFVMVKGSIYCLKHNPKRRKARKLKLPKFKR